MKKLFLIALLVVSVGIIGCDKAEASKKYDPCQSKHFSKIINECGSDEVREKHNAEIGVGMDITLYEDKTEGAIIDRISEEYRYDWQNGEHTAYTVFRVNLWKRIKRLVKKD
jgi:uncharacterized lipoprotein YehR (DUF1307 family)